MEEAYLEETTVHSLLKPYKVRGEWFHIDCLQLLTEIRNIESRKVNKSKPVSANPLPEDKIDLILNHLQKTRHSTRNTVIFLLSIELGLKPGEISKLNWGNLISKDGSFKEKLTSPSLRQAVLCLHGKTPLGLKVSDKPVILSERGGRMSAQVVSNFFQKLYRDVNLSECSALSGKATYGKRINRLIKQAIEE
jgi:integrase